MTPQEFFDAYGQALSARDVGAIADRWAVPSLVLGPTAANAVMGRAEVEAFFNDSLAQYEAVAAARADLVDVRELMPGLFACAVRWDHLDDTGSSTGGENGYYVIRLSDAAGVIEVYAPGG